MNDKTDIEEDMKYISLDLDILINNIINLPELTAIAIKANKEPLLLKFKSILIEAYKVKEKANKYDSLVEKIRNKKSELESQCGGNVFHIQQTLNAEIRLLEKLKGE